MGFNELYKKIPQEATHLYMTKKCVHTVQKCNYIEPIHAQQKKKIGIGSVLMVCQILNDAFYIQMRSISSEF